MEVPGALAGGPGLPQFAGGGMPAEVKYRCVHCGSELHAFELPQAGGWATQYHYACFNDDCPYYCRGWDWMMSQYSRKASYRYRIDPASGCESPLAVWSATALRNRIVDPASEKSGECAAASCSQRSEPPEKERRR